MAKEKTPVERTNKMPETSCVPILKASLSGVVGGFKSAFRIATCNSFNPEVQAAEIFDCPEPKTSSVEREKSLVTSSNVFASKSKVLENTMKKKKGVNSGEQVGGHEGAFKMQGPTVLKLANKAELDYYKRINAAAQISETKIAWPIRFAPAFHGIEAANGQVHIVLENLLMGYKNPCIMDLKIGTRTAEDTASAFKQLKMQLLDEVSGAAQTGVQLIAMSVNRAKTQESFKMGKHNGYKNTAKQSLQMILGYFLGDGQRLNKSLIMSYKEKIQEILDAFTTQRKYQFIGSSLLFVYEGNPDNRSGPVQCDVRMIDFAHVIEPEEAKRVGDPYYEKGLRSILSALEALENAQHLAKTGMEHLLAANCALRWRHKTKAAAQDREGNALCVSPVVSCPSDENPEQDMSDGSVSPCSNGSASSGSDGSASPRCTDDSLAKEKLHSLPLSIDGGHTESGISLAV